MATWNAVATDVMDALLAYALDLPGSWEDVPWEDDLVAKVGKKIFVFFGPESIGVKLPSSAQQALAVRGAEPSGYGLGKYGWVVVPITGEAAPERGVLEDWIEESYRAVAAKKLIAELDGR